MGGQMWLRSECRGCTNNSSLRNPHLSPMDSENSIKKPKRPLRKRENKMICHSSEIKNMHATMLCVNDNLAINNVHKLNISLLLMRVWTTP